MESSKNTFRIIYEGEIYYISPEYYDKTLEYLYYDSLEKSQGIIHLNKIETLTLKDFKSRYDHEKEKKYLSCVLKYNSFLKKNTYALNQSTISTRLDKLISKPMFLFSHSLLELDHWCKCVVEVGVKAVLETLGINLEYSNKKERFTRSIEKLRKFEESLIEEAQVWEIQKTATVIPAELDPTMKWQDQKEQLLLEATASDSPRLEAFCHLLQEGIEKFEPTAHHILHHSKRHLYLETFRKVKRDIIQAIVTCIPETAPRSKSKPLNRHHPNSQSTSSSFYSSLSSLSSISSESPSRSYTYNEFETLLCPSSQTSLSRFLETFEGCRQRMLYHNNPLHPTEYYFVDAGYISDPRRLCKVTVPKKVTLHKTIEFHRRLLKKETELGYFKELGKDNSEAAQEHRCYSRYYSMLAYSIRVHYFNYNHKRLSSEPTNNTTMIQPQGNKINKQSVDNIDNENDNNNTNNGKQGLQTDDEFLSTAFEIVIAIESYLGEVGTDFSFVGREKIDKIIEARLKDFERIERGNSQTRKLLALELDLERQALEASNHRNSHPITIKQYASGIFETNNNNNNNSNSTGNSNLGKKRKERKKWRATISGDHINEEDYAGGGGGIGGGIDVGCSSNSPIERLSFKHIKLAIKKHEQQASKVTDRICNHIQEHALFTKIC